MDRQFNKILQNTFLFFFKVNFRLRSFYLMKILLNMKLSHYILNVKFKCLAKIISLKRSQWYIYVSSKFLTSCLKSGSTFEVDMPSYYCKLLSIRFERSLFLSIFLVENVRSHEINYLYNRIYYMLHINNFFIFVYFLGWECLLSSHLRKYISASD